ncbi:OsmC family protein [Chitinophaga sedimenti]|uniref:OsmC family protein n=1 Tax=Chitinophaga sedimenti TaxID=2033606 RepID=UPI00249DD6CB|nr:OsmC family protein [Chitinophaga sedimenti]
MKRSATANWQGTGKEGKGKLSTDSGVLKDTQYSFNTRFEDGIGTNPEELIAAAHAGCFTMKLSFNLTGAGFTPGNIDTKAAVTFENGAIPNIHLTVKATVPGIDKAKFDELVLDAKQNCPISKLLNTDITYEAELV